MSKFHDEYLMAKTTSCRNIPWQEVVFAIILFFQPVLYLLIRNSGIVVLFHIDRPAAHETQL